MIWGAQDKLFPAAYAEPWRKGLPDCRVEIIEACGHAVTADQSAACADAILGFLKGK